MKLRYLPESGGGLPIAPLLDVIFLLLIFFMLISRYLPPTLDVTLPEAQAAQINDDRSVLISIDETGTLAVNGAEVEWELLPSELEGYEPDTQVRINADRTADYDWIVRAMDASAQAGLSRIALETRPGST